MMTDRITQHALTRMAQRAIRHDDLDLIARIGTEVEDGYLVRTKDCQTFEHALKQLIKQAWRLNGKRVVVAGDRVVTAYHACPTKKRQLLRHAEQRAVHTG